MLAYVKTNVLSQHITYTNKPIILKSKKSDKRRNILANFQPWQFRRDSMKCFLQ